MKILVIGGSYFAGRVFVEELAKNPRAEIHIFNRGRFPLRIAGVTEHVGDRENPKQICDALPAEDWDAVVDFCAYTPSHIETMLQNLPGTIRQYVFISTTTIYEKSSALPINEDAPKLRGPQADLGEYARYGYDKWLAEGALTQECTRMGISHTTLRPAIIYGYYNYAPRETYFFDLLRSREPIVIPEKDLALFSFIWVVDMARLIIRCLGEEKTYNDAFNLAAEELVSYSRIVEVLGQITAKDIEPLRLSVEDIERRRIPLPFPLDEHLVYSGAKISRLFDVNHTPFKDGLRESLKYYLMVRKRNDSPTT